MKKKIVKKYADLILQANNATGRKEAVALIHKAAKLKTKFDNYEMMSVSYTHLTLPTNTPV